MSGTRGFAAVVVAVGALLVCGFSPQFEQPAGGRDLDCAECHDCDHPTSEAPCLKEVSCPRHAHAQGLNIDLGPDVSILDELEDLYVPVYFNHRVHASMGEMEDGCVLCHHYTPPDMPHPACRECHPAEIIHEDLSQPGLKGAYHRQCLGCHVEWDADTKCEICHEKKAGGALGGTATTYRSEPRHEPIVMKELIIFPTEYDDGDEVPFHHKNHVDAYEGECSFCHEHQGCAGCHTHREESHPIGDPGVIDMHDTCYQCHDESGECEHCHGRDAEDYFKHKSTGWPLKSYHEKLTCSSCHTRRGMQFMRPSSNCDSCHPGGWDPDRFNHAVTGVALDEEHGELDCGDCHLAGVGVAASCDDCHDDDRKYDRRRGFEPES